MYDASSLAKNTQALAISIGSPKRPAGICSRYFFFNSSGRTSVIGVFIKPGAIAFAVIPREATSAAIDLVIEIIAPFEAA